MKSVRALILNNKNEVLLTKRRDPEIRELDKLILPGGKVKDGESVSEALVRELKEELDIYIKSFVLVERQVTENEEYDDFEIYYYYVKDKVTISNIHNAPEIGSSGYYNINNLQENNIAFGEINQLREVYNKIPL